MRASPPPHFGGNMDLPKARIRRAYAWNCAHCGNAFETTHYGQRYCSRRCREYAYRLRKHERAKAEKQAVEAKIC